ncbi:uncharacterized protein K441DRAFT_656885 [Cenococcum geophilum 1.58]|uniref:uncharacterized protein n=1 Tax=Cenococcum geophilum 1.58 TaxID=794803 RepID=UPI0035900378|nr:hypothetical protein K441DRAFT_656885 [Cenococcum geophilum 1.58]
MPRKSRVLARTNCCLCRSLASSPRRYSHFCRCSVLTKNRKIKMQKFRNEEL